MIAREVNIPLGIEDAVALIAGAHSFRKIDAMRIGKRVYALNISLGISASVISGTTAKNKSRFGLIAYFGTAILKIFTFRSRYLSVAIDGKTLKSRAIEVGILNCGSLANMLYPKGPDVKIDDGHLDVWIVSGNTVRDYHRYLFQMITRRPARHLSHFINSEKSISINSKVPLSVQADGDIIVTTPIDIEVLPGALTVLVTETPVPVPVNDLDRNKVMAEYLAWLTNRKAKERT